MTHENDYLATNASDSDANLVRLTLRRVGLEDFFAGIFTSKELQACKPDPLFYQSVFQECDFIAREVVMIGDDYLAEVRGARRAGLRAIWYDPLTTPYPIRQPMNEIEIQSMRNCRRL